jgi:hypothetical protein
VKLLLLEHPQHTHGTFVVFEGLSRVLGSACVDVFPFKALYHTDEENMHLGAVPWYRDAYADYIDGHNGKRKTLPGGIPPFAPGESLTTSDERVIPRSTLPSSYRTTTPQRMFSEAEIVAALDAGHYDAIVLGNSHRVPTIALARLRERAAKLPPIVYIDAGERDEFNAHWWHVFRPQLVFKQILTPAIEAMRGSPQVPCEIVPLPLANLFVYGGPDALREIGAVMGDRAIDVVASFGPTWDTRAAVHARIARVSKALGLSAVLKPLVCSPLHGLPYFAVLAASKVGVSMRGSGRDTDRYWQVPALGAALLCDGTMGCIHPFPFEDGATAAFYSTIDEVGEQLRMLIRDAARRMKIATAGRRHLHRFHSVEARALFFLEILRERLGIDYDAEQGGSARSWRERLEWSAPLPEWRGPVAGFHE